MPRARVFPSNSYRTRHPKVYPPMPGLDAWETRTQGLQSRVSQVFSQSCGRAQYPIPQNARPCLLDTHSAELRSKPLYGRANILRLENRARSHYQRFRRRIHPDTRGKRSALKFAYAGAALTGRYRDRWRLRGKNFLWNICKSRIGGRFSITRCGTRPGFESTTHF